MQGMNKPLRSCASLLVLLAALAGCTRSGGDELLAAPQVGDMYASELSHFAQFEYEGRSYGLMKVVSVTDGSVTVVTDSAAWPDRSGANGDLGGDPSNVRWDTQNTIRIARAELPALYEEERI